MKKWILLAMALCFIFALTACAPGPNPHVDTIDENGKTAGFLRGLWHGFIAFFTFIISLFTDKVNVYEVRNTGGWYDFGFILGVMIFFGGGGRAGAGSKKDRNRD